jgi:hypothetical protein
MSVTAPIVQKFPGSPRKDEREREREAGHQHGNLAI